MERNLMKGNEALAEAAIRAGCKCFFGYPITPQTEIAAYLAKYMPKNTGVFILPFANNSQKHLEVWKRNRNFAEIFT